MKKILLIAAILPLASWAHAGCIFKCVTVRVPTVARVVHDVTHSIDVNAKGIDHSIKANAKTLSDIGRITGCLSTTCISEVYIKYEKDKAEHNTQNQLDDYATRVKASAERMGQAELTNFLVTESTRLNVEIKSHEDFLASSDDRAKAIGSTLEILEAEIDYRNKVLADGLTVQGGDPSLKPIADGFQAVLAAGDADANNKLGIEVGKSAVQRQAQVNVIFAGIARWLEPSVLLKVRDQAKAALDFELTAAAGKRVALETLKAEQTLIVTKQNETIRPPAPPRPPVFPVIRPPVFFRTIFR